MIERNVKYNVYEQNGGCLGEVKFDWYSPRTDKFVCVICGWLITSKNIDTLQLEIEDTIQIVLELEDQVSKNRTKLGRNYLSKTTEGIILAHISE